MPSLMFIAPADPGEAVLAGAALNVLLGPGMVVDVACAEPALPLFRATPGLRSIRALGGAGFRGWLRLARDAAEERYDLVLDLSRGRLGYAVRADRRIVRGSPRVLRHLLEEFAALVGAERLAPHIWLDEKARADAAATVSLGGPMLAIALGGAGWPAERFAAAARRLVSGAGPLSGAEVVVLGDSGAADAARTITLSLDADGVSARNLAGRLDIVAAGAALERVTLCLASDPALMHVAASVGAPTLALFGASDERIMGPYGPRTRALRGRTYEDVMSGAAPGDGLDALSVDTVEQAALDLLHAGGLR